MNDACAIRFVLNTLIAAWIRKRLANQLVVSSEVLGALGQQLLLSTVLEVDLVTTMLMLKHWQQTV
jgi:hypothetical protein